MTDTSEWGEDASGTLIIAGWVKLPPENVADVTAAGVTMMQATQAESGCVDYTFSEVLGEPGYIRIFERWESADALAAHMASPHMAEFNKALGSAGITGADFAKYTVARKGPLF